MKYSVASVVSGVFPSLLINTASAQPIHIITNSQFTQSKNYFESLQVQSACKNIASHWAAVSVRTLYMARIKVCEQRFKSLCQSDIIFWHRALGAGLFINMI